MPDDDNFTLKLLSSKITNNTAGYNGGGIIAYATAEVGIFDSWWYVRYIIKKNQKNNNSLRKKYGEKQMGYFNYY